MENYKEDLRNLKRLVLELNQTNSSNDKKKVLKKHPECKKILYYTYNPFRQFYLTSDNLKKNANLVEEPNNLDLYELLDTLAEREISGHQAIAVTNGFIKQNPAYADLILRIIDRNLKTRADAKLINKVWPGLIPSFDVALAQKFDDQVDKVDFKRDDWYASRKLDGVRVITIINNDGIKFFSRKGKEFHTLDVVKKELEQFGTTWARGGLVLDGEMCIVDENGNEDFTSMIKLIRRKDFTVPNPKYKIFDMMVEEVFESTNAQLNTKLSKRINAINAMIKTGVFDGRILDPVEQIPIKSKQHLAAMTKEAVDAGWEGLIIRKDTIYEGKRTNNMLKVKKFHDAEYTVKNVVMGPIRYIENGKEKEEEMLSAIEIEHRGYKVSVGSGFSMEERKHYYKHPEELIGTEVTVVYFEETTNKQGGISLRFPTVKAIYKEKREI